MHTTDALNINQSEPIAADEVVSVVVPIYNASDYLRDCLDSLKSQSYKNLQIVMVNDGSTDSSAEICREYVAADSRFLLLEQYNSGQSCARNHGLRYATGSFLSFIDSDDVLHPRAIEAMVAILTRNDQIDYVKCNTVIGQEYVFGPLSGVYDVYQPEHILQLALNQKLDINSIWGMVCRRQLLNGLWFRSGKYYEDLDIFYKIFLRARKIAYMPDKLYFYRMHPNSFIHTFSLKRIDALDVTDDMVKYISCHCPGLVKAAEDRRFSAHYNVLLLLAANRVNFPLIEKRCWDVVTRQRAGELFQPGVRLKNRLGALLSYCGPVVVKAIGFLFYNRLYK